jgi:hypothetical protein
MVLTVPKVDDDGVAIVHNLSHSFDVGDPVGLPKGIDCTGNSNLACFKDSYQVI